MVVSLPELACHLICIEIFSEYLRDTFQRISPRINLPTIKYAMTDIFRNSLQLENILNSNSSPSTEFHLQIHPTFFSFLPTIRGVIYLLNSEL